MAVSKHAVGAPIAPWVRRERRKSTNEGGFMSNAHILVIHHKGWSTTEQRCSRKTQPRSARIVVLLLRGII